MSERDPKAQVKAKGEFNRTFNLDEVREDPTKGAFVFVSPQVQSYILQVTPDTIDIVDGQKRTVPGLTIFFQNFLYRTDSEKEAELIRKTDAYKKGRIAELGKLRHQTKQRRLDEEAKRVAADPELTKAVLAQLKQGKADTPEVAGSK